jgi:cytochrome c oxidase subunit 2
MFGEATRALGSLMSGAISTDDGTFWLPRRGSDFASQVDFNFGLVYWISVFFFALVTFLMVFFAVRYRQRPGHEPEKSTSHNTPLEVLWSVIPTLIVIVLFWSGYKTYLNMTVAPQNAYEVLVTGQKWNWLFTYPNGYIDSQLHVPVDTPVKLTMTSEDVIHSFFVPDFRIKRDVIPGRYTRLWFTAIETGDYDILCTEYCGTNHWNMLSKLVVHERAEFDSWLEEASDFLSKMPPAEAGELLYNMRGCKQCHSVDGTPGIGPSFLGKFGSEEKLLTGETVVVEENYIRESIVDPQARIVAGFDPVMPTYQGRLKDEEITAIIEYMKTLSEQ